MDAEFPPESPGLRVSIPRAGVNEYEPGALPSIPRLTEAIDGTLNHQGYLPKRGLLSYRKPALERSSRLPCLSRSRHTRQLLLDSSGQGVSLQVFQLKVAAAHGLGDGAGQP